MCSVRLGRSQLISRSLHIRGWNQFLGWGRWQPVGRQHNSVFGNMMFIIRGVVRYCYNSWNGSITWEVETYPAVDLDIRSRYIKEWMCFCHFEKVVEFLCMWKFWDSWYLCLAFKTYLYPVLPVQLRSNCPRIDSMTIFLCVLFERSGTKSEIRREWFKDEESPLKSTPNFNASSLISPTAPDSRSDIGHRTLSVFLWLLS